MTRKRRRLWILLACGLGLGSAATLALLAFSDSLVFFLAPSDLATKAPAPGRSFRLGGLVEQGSVQPDGTFRASEVLAKHDETYMPKDVADALKKSGHWNPTAGPPPPAATWNTIQPKKTGG
jgi:cytochrome c-type biogenesis protein CcmE